MMPWPPEDAYDPTAIRRVEGEPLTREDVVALLRASVAEAGGQGAWGKKHGMSGTYVGDVLRGRRDPGSLILTGLRLRRQDVYLPIEDRP